MASPDDIVSVLTLELGPDTIPAPAFVKSVRAFADLLNGIAQDACGDAKAVIWEVSVARGSTLIGADIAPAADRTAARRVRELIREPPERTRARFRDFPRPVEGTRIWLGKRPEDMLRNDEDAPAKPDSFAEYGTVEGRLETLSARGGPHFVIYEPIWDRGVRCTVPDDLVDATGAMWRQRVAAHGMVRYDAEGRPMSIRADTVEPFPCDRTPIEAFRGLLRAG